jgi:hypothetical protein
MVFGFLVFPDLEELDLVGPWEMISIYYPSGINYGTFHQDADAPKYLRKVMSAED